MPRVDRHAGPKAGVSPLLLALLLLPPACGGGPSEDPAQAGAPSKQQDCEMRGEPISVGMDRASDDGALLLELVTADPMPPETGDNGWVIGVRNAAGDPVSGATVIVRPFMVDHGHGSAVQQGVELDDGVYELSPIDLTMPGYWELTFGVTESRDSGEVDVTFPVCVAR